LLAALAAAVAVAYPLLSASLEHRLLRADWETAKAEATAVRDSIGGDHRGAEGKRKLDEALAVIASRPGTREVKLIDPTFRVAASVDPADIGERDYDAGIAGAIEHGREYFGREADPDADQEDFEYIVPLRLADGTHAFEITRDDAYLDAQLDSVRRAIAVAGLFGLIAAAAAFWPLGGRRLLRAHRLALENATLDGLTQLGNHRAFQDELGHAVARARRYREPLSLILFDLDDFKQANDRHGHRHGDELLRRVAEVLRATRDSDRAFRLGGDEFAVLLPATGEPDAALAARRIQAELAPGHVPMSAGIGELSNDVDADALRQQADSAVYEAKRRGGEIAVAFSEIASDVALVTRARGQALRDAIAEGAVTSVFQPIWELHGDQDLLAVEALARIDARFGFQSPAEAFEVAEQIGRVHDLDVLCVTRALERADDLPADALLFINLAPQTLDRDAAGDDWLCEAVEQSGLDPRRVVVEVTERLGGRTPAVLKALQRLRDLGIRVALDDVGTGNSGLELLRAIGADFVKIDRSIVKNASTDGSARAVLVAIAAFASHTGATVIAEGIEDANVLAVVHAVDKLIDAGGLRIHAGQGYGIGRPAHEMPAGRLPAILA
jgi:diguanylate cyclase (GGDEF)-like protein